MSLRHCGWFPLRQGLKTCALGSKDYEFKFKLPQDPVGDHPRVTGLWEAPLQHHHCSCTPHIMVDSPEPIPAELDLGLVHSEHPVGHHY